MGTQFLWPCFFFFFDYSLPGFLFLKTGCSSSRLLDWKQHTSAASFSPPQLVVSLCSILGQSWQAGNSVAVTPCGSEGLSSPGGHLNGTWCPSHLQWCKRCPAPGKAEEEGGRGCFKNFAFWKTWLRGCSREEKPKAQLLTVWVAGGK